MNAAIVATVTLGTKPPVYSTSHDGADGADGAATVLRRYGATSRIRELSGYWRPIGRVENF